MKNFLKVEIMMLANQSQDSFSDYLASRIDQISIKPLECVLNTSGAADMLDLVNMGVSLW